MSTLFSLLPPVEYSPSPSPRPGGRGYSFEFSLPKPSSSPTASDLIKRVTAMKNPSEKSSGRQDVLATEDAALSKAVMATSRTMAAPRSQCLHKDDKSQARLKMRRDLIESQTSDPKGYERLIGESNLTSINYLERGRRS
ncbi:MAG: hypothetical protein ABL974_19700, partial [Prosthecobacter sp.]